MILMWLLVLGVGAEAAKAEPQNVRAEPTCSLSRTQKIFAPVIQVEPRCDNSARQLRYIMSLHFVARLPYRNNTCINKCAAYSVNTGFVTIR